MCPNYTQMERIYYNIVKHHKFVWFEGILHRYSITKNTGRKMTIRFHISILYDYFKIYILLASHSCHNFVAYSIRSYYVSKNPIQIHRTDILIYNERYSMLFFSEERILERSHVRYKTLIIIFRQTMIRCKMNYH